MTTKEAVTGEQTLARVPKFTEDQIADWRNFEDVRQEGHYNMFSPDARLATGLDRDEYLFVTKNYSELKKQAEHIS